jgi:hypothetical protein
MRYVKTFGLALAAMFVLAMTVAAMASAADPLFLFGTQTSTISGGSGKLTTLGSFFGLECKKVTGSVTPGGNDSETFTGSIDFEECNANSLGDKTGIILFKFDGLLCWINESKLEVGAYILATEDVHLENVPLIGLLVFLKGSSQIAALTPVGVSTTLLTAKLSGASGDQSPTSCVDLGTTLKPEIKVSENESATEHDAAINQEFDLHFATAGTLDG